MNFSLSALILVLTRTEACQPQSDRSDSQTACPSGVSDINEYRIRLETTRQQLTDLEKRLNDAEEELRSYKEFSEQRHDSLNTSLHFHRSDVNQSQQAFEETVSKAFETVYENMNSQHEFLESQLFAFAKDFNSTLSNTLEEQERNLTARFEAFEKQAAKDLKQVNDLVTNQITALKTDSETTHNQLRSDQNLAIQATEGKLEQQNTDLASQIGQLRQDFGNQNNRESKFIKCYMFSAVISLLSEPVTLFSSGESLYV